MSFRCFSLTILVSMFCGIELVTAGRERKEKTQLCFFPLSSIKMHGRLDKKCYASILMN